MAKNADADDGSLDSLIEIQRGLLDLRRLAGLFDVGTSGLIYAIADKFERQARKMDANVPE